MIKKQNKTKTNKKTIIMVFLLLSDYWYFLEDFNGVKLFFPVAHEKRGRHLWKGQEKCCLGLHGYLFVGGDDNINAWLHMLEWNGTAKRRLKQEKRVLVTEMNFTKKCQYSNKSQNNPEILCTSVVGPDVDRNKGDGWMRKGWWVGRSCK